MDTVKKTDIERITKYCLEILGTEHLTDGRKLEIITSCLSDWKNCGFDSTDFWLAIN